MRALLLLPLCLALSACGVGHAVSTVVTVPIKAAGKAIDVITLDQHAAKPHHA
jgi:hypothetical protein